MNTYYLFIRPAIILGLLAVLAAAVFPQQKAADSELWSRIYPTGKQPPQGVPTLFQEHAVQRTAPQAVRTKDGYLTTSPPPNIRMHPTTWSSQSEMDIIQSPTNPDVVIAGSNAAGSPSVSWLSQGWYISTNGGSSWYGGDTLPPHQAAGMMYYTSDPQVAVDRNGTMYFGTLLFYSASDVVISRSTNNGATWSNFVPLPDIGRNVDKDWFAVDDVPGSPYLGNVYGAYTDFNGSGPAYRRIRFGRSTDGGSSWLPAQTVNISGMNGYLDQGVNLAVGPNGEVYAIWTNYQSTDLTLSRVGFNKSTDGGASWPSSTYATTTVQDIRGYLYKGGYTFRVNSFPYIAVDNSSGPRRGWVYAVFAARPGYGVSPSIYLVRSTDGGTTWSDTLRVNQDTSGKDHWFPACAVDPATGQLFVVYYDSRNFAFNDSAQVYLSRSIDGGATFEDFLVSDHSFLVAPIPGLAYGYAGDYIGITALNGVVWPTWNDNSTGIHQAYTARMQFEVNYGFVRGTVTTSDIPPVALPGVHLDFVGATDQEIGTSDALGRYRAGAPVDTATHVQQYTLRAQKFGYLPWTDTVTLSLGDTVTRDVVMSPAPGGYLAGRVYRPDSTGLRANIRIRFNGVLVVPDLFSDSATGNFIYPLPYGTYSISVDPPSPYATREFPDLVINADTVRLNVPVRQVLEPSVTDLFDTLGVGQSNTRSFILTNTTADSVPFAVMNNAQSTRLLATIQKQFDERSPMTDPSRVFGKDEMDVRFGPPQTMSHGGPDAFGYIWLDSDEPGGPVYSYRDIHSAGALVDTNLFLPSGVWNKLDEGYYPLRLPFRFGYYGTDYDSLFISTNGYLAVVRPNGDSYDNNVIPSPLPPNGIIAGFWDDLDLRKGGAIRTYYDTAGSQFIIQLDSIGRYSGDAVYSYQYLLRANGQVLVQYRDMPSGGVNSATVGIENSTGWTGLQVVFNNSYIHNNLCLEFKNQSTGWLSSYPAAGLLHPGESVVIVNAFDAAGLTANTEYGADLYIEANHPDVSPRSITIASHLKVTPISGPAIHVQPLARDFGTVVIGQTRTDSVSIRNIGDAALNVSHIVSTDPVFSVTPAGGTLATGQSMKVYITFDPVRGTQNGLIRIVSDDPLNDTITVAVSGVGLGVPHMTAQVDSLIKTVQTGGRDSITFVVRNDGTAGAAFSARAIVYPRARLLKGITPLALQLRQAETPAAQPGQGTAARTPAALSGADAMRATSSGTIDTRRITRSATVGDVITSWPAPAGISLPWGLGWNTDASNLLVSDPAGSPIENHYVSYDGVLLQSIATPWRGSWPGDAEYYSGAFYQVNVGGNDAIYKLAVDGSVLGYITDPGGIWSSISQRGLGYDPIENVFFIGGWNQNRVYKVKGFGSDNPGEVILSFPFNNISGLAYHPVTRTLWIAINAATDMIYEVNPTNGQVIQQFRSPGTGSYTGAGLSFNSDGNLWCVNQSEARVYLIKTEAPPLGAAWLSVRPMQGRIEIGDSVVFVATFDGSDSTISSNPGNYYGRLEIAATNSAMADSIILPARMYLEPPAGARMAISTDSLGFGSVELAHEETLAVRIRNFGASTLTVTNVNSTNPQFRASPASFSVNSLDTLWIQIIFTAPMLAGPQSGTMSFESNDPLAPTLRVAGRAFGIPHIALSRDSLSFTVPTGPDTVAENLTIRNTGTDTLHFMLQELLATAVQKNKPRAAQPLVAPPKGVIDTRRGDPVTLGTGGPDDFGYEWIDSDQPGGPVFSWVDITSAGTQITGLYDDSNVGPFPIGFDFPYYGQTYNTIRVCSNGWLSPTSTSTSLSNTTIPSTQDPNNALFVWWDDLVFTSSSFAYYYNDAVNGRFIISFINVSHFGSGEPGLYTFQAILYPSGNIVYQYLTMDQTLTSASIGVENQDGTIGLQVVFNNTYMHNNLAILILRDTYAWMSEVPERGTIAPGDSQAVQVRAHPGLIPNGTYLGRLGVSGNTPDVALLPVRMDVVGGVSFLRVTSPNGGEVLYSNQPSTIRWVCNLVDSIKIEYSTNAGAAWLSVVNQYPAATGSFIWTVPEVTTGQALIRVSDIHHPGINDASDGVFTIEGPPPPPPAGWEDQWANTYYGLNCVSIVDQNVAWVAGNGGSVLHTTNGGAVWIQGPAWLPTDVQSVCAMSATRALVCVSWTDDARIYRTTDGGGTWAMVYQNTGTGAYLNGISMINDTLGYAFGNPVNHVWLVLRTTDGGASWALFRGIWQRDYEQGFNNAFQCLDDRTAWVGTDHARVYRTTNAGINWNTVATPDWSSSSLSFVNGDLGLLGSVSGQTAQSMDGGALWTAAGDIGEGPVSIAGVEVPLPRWWAAAGLRIYKTTNRGLTWTFVHQIDSRYNHIAMRYLPNEHLIVGYAVGYNGRISRYTEYVQFNAPVTIPVQVEERWNLLSNPLTVWNDSLAYLYPSALSPHAFGYDSSQGYMQSERLLNGLGYWAKFPGRAVHSIRGMMRTNDTASVKTGWNIIGSISRPASVASLITLGTTRTSLVYSYSSGYRVADSIQPGMGCWVKMSTAGRLVITSLPGQSKQQAVEKGTERLGGLNELSFEDAGGNKQTLFFGKQPSDAFQPEYYELPPEAPEGAFDVRFLDSGRGYLARTYAATAGSEKLTLALSSAAYPVKLRWRVQPDDLQRFTLTDDAHGELLKVQLAGAGGSLAIADERVRRLVLVVEHRTIPRQFALLQNYPNPFNPRTSIQYWVPVASHVSLRVYDLLGREVAVLVNELKQPGEYAAAWLATDVPSGVYFFRMVAGDFAETKKMLLIR